MRLFEISVGNEEGWSYFFPDEDVGQYFTFCERCNWPIEFTDRQVKLKWQGGADPGDFASATLGNYAKRHVAAELQRQFPDVVTREPLIVNRADETEGKKRSKYRGEDIVEITCSHQINSIQ